MNLKKIILKNDTKGGRYFDLFIQLLIIVSILSFSLETLPKKTQTLDKILRIVEIITVIIFSLEYVLRIWANDFKIKFLFSFYGIIDLMAILPFYLTVGIDLRSVRIFRLLKLMTVLKMVRYNKAINRIHRAILIAKEELILFMSVTCMLLYLSSVGIYYFEKNAQPESFRSVFDGLWWAVSTLTTVGYGDVYPITVGGKIFTFIILMLGLGIVSIPAGLFASALSKARELE